MRHPIAPSRHKPPADIHNAANAIYPAATKCLVGSPWISLACRAARRASVGSSGNNRR